MTPEGAHELYVLQREFGIGAHEALNVRPAWELDNLLMHLADEQRSTADG